MTPHKKIRLTQQKFKQLTDELEELVTVGRKLLADKLADYRTDDQSEENAGYSDVLEEKRWMEERIKTLEHMLEDAEITHAHCDLDNVSIGCSVTILRDGKKRTFTVVPSLDSNPSEGKISEESPMGKALLGKKVGDKISVNSPSSKCNCEILKIASGE